MFFTNQNANPDCLARALLQTVHILQISAIFLSFIEVFILKRLKYIPVDNTLMEVRGHARL